MWPSLPYIEVRLLPVNHPLRDEKSHINPVSDLEPNIAALFINNTKSTRAIARQGKVEVDLVVVLYWAQELKEGS